MSEPYDVLVVGAGVVGVCTARALHERGARVALLDRGDVGAGASFGNAGWVSPSHCLPIPQPGAIRGALRWLLDPESPFYLRPRADPQLLSWLWHFWRACAQSAVERTSALRHELAGRSLDHYARWSHELSFGWTRRGLLVVCASKAGLDRARIELDRLRELGGTGELLGPAALRDRVPELSADLAGGIAFPRDGHLDPAAFVRAMAELLVERGVDLRTREALLELEWSRGPGARIRTPRGEIRAREVVVAAGAWTRPLVAAAGIRLLLEAAKGYSLTVPTSAPFDRAPLLLSEARVAITPLAGRVRFAGTLELAGLDLRIAPRRVAAIRRAVRAFLPGLPAPPEVEPWAGLRPLTPDDLPIIGRPAGTRGLVLATGHGMSGVAHAPMTGELVAQLLAGEKPALPLEPFSPDRFG